MTVDKNYPLLVVQREISGHPRRTEHWSLVVMLDSSKGEIHELQGNYDTFHYTYEINQDWTKSSDLCGGCLVGYVTQSTLLQLPEILKEVPIIRHDPDHDCQTWIVEALRVMKDKGIVFRDMTEKKLREELVVELERNETGHDVVYERIHV